MERRPPSRRVPAAAAAVASVLGNDDLLVEILLRVDSPTILIHAAFVCRRWLRRASDRGFLLRFRALHPPRILGLHVQTGSDAPRFLPLPQPEALEAVARHALEALRPSLGAQDRSMQILDCRKDHPIVESSGRSANNNLAVRSLLRQVQDTPLPKPPPPPERYYGRCQSEHMFLLEDHGVSCLHLTFSMNKPKIRADFRILRSGVWGVWHDALTEIRQVPLLEIMYCQKLVVGRKVYMPLINRLILGLDLDTASIFVVKLPDGAGSCKLSRGRQSGLYLIGATGFQLRVWHGDGLGQWVLDDTISVMEACGRLDVQRWEPDDGRAPVSVVDAGDNAEFLFLNLEVSGILCCMQLENRIAEKVDGMIPENCRNVIYPVAMDWLPVFPELDEANQ